MRTLTKLWADLLFWVLINQGTGKYAGDACTVAEKDTVNIRQLIHRLIASFGILEPLWLPNKNPFVTPVFHATPPVLQAQVEVVKGYRAFVADILDFVDFAAANQTHHLMHYLQIHKFMDSTHKISMTELSTLELCGEETCTARQRATE